VSALVDGARVDTEAVGSEGGRGASRETSVAAATGGADCHVRCHCRHCRHCLVCQGDASAGTGMPFQTLGKNPCARAAMDVSACGNGDGSRFGHVAQEWGRKKRGPYRGKDTTEGKTETMYVGIAVGIVLHRGRGGVVRDVVRLVEQRTSERMKGWDRATDWLDGRS
jgi:hypothetical protein